MKKIILIFIILLLNLYCFAQKIYLPAAYPAMPFLMSENIEKILFSSVQTEIIPKIIRQEKGLYLIPTNIASKLSTNIDFDVIGIVYSPILKIVSNENDVQSLNDIDFFIGAPGSSPDVLAKYFFEKKKISPEIQYRPSPQIMKMMFIDKVQNAILPEPLATKVVSENKNLKILADINKLWYKENNNGIPQLTLISIETKFDENIFREINNNSNKLMNNPKEFKTIWDSKIKIKLSNEQFIQICKSTKTEIKSAQNEKENVEKYLSILKRNNPKSVGKIENFIK